MWLNCQNVIHWSQVLSIQSDGLENSWMWLEKPHSILWGCLLHCSFTINEACFYLPRVEFLLGDWEQCQADSWKIPIQQTSFCLVYFWCLGPSPLGERRPIIYNDVWLIYRDATQLSGAKNSDTMKIWMSGFSRMKPLFAQWQSWENYFMTLDLRMCSCQMACNLAWSHPVNIFCWRYWRTEIYKHWPIAIDKLKAAIAEILLEILCSMMEHFRIRLQQCITFRNQHLGEIILKTKWNKQHPFMLMPLE